MGLETDRIRLICFDVDGTLSDTDDQYVRRFIPYVRGLARLTSQRDPEKLARWMVYQLEDPGAWLMKLADEIGLDRPLDRASNFIDQLLPRNHIHSFMLIKGIRQMLVELREQYVLAVVSARGEHKTMAFLEQFELREYFAAIATGQTCARTKPCPDPIAWAADQIGVSTAETLMVGDTTFDIRAGKAAGSQTAGVLCGFGKQEELQKAGADILLANTCELSGLLLSISRNPDC